MSDFCSNVCGCVVSDFSVCVYVCVCVCVCVVIDLNVCGHVLSDF